MDMCLKGECICVVGLTETEKLLSACYLRRLLVLYIEEMMILNSKKDLSSVSELSEKRKRQAERFENLRLRCAPFVIGRLKNYLNEDIDLVILKQLKELKIKLPL